MNTRIKLITRRGAPWFVRSTKPQKMVSTATATSASTTTASSDFDNFLSASDPELTALEALLAETQPVATSRLRPRTPGASRTMLTSRLRTLHINTTTTPVTETQEKI